LRTTKPFTISKQVVYTAFKAVKANAGAASVDQQSIEAFETDVQDKLYKIWNRMASGRDFPPPVNAVAIAKKQGGERMRGVPTVADRVAQMVGKMTFEPAVEPIFLADSYGYRPGKSAVDAVSVTRQRCWRYDWVLEFDIKGLFDYASWYSYQLPNVELESSHLITFRSYWSTIFGLRLIVRSALKG
jgi:retron-type reverse transcriptase